MTTSMQGYESPSVTDLGSFADLTQQTTGVSQDHSKAVGTKMH
jgi:hypothetical protein